MPACARACTPGLHAMAYKPAVSCRGPMRVHVVNRAVTSTGSGDAVCGHGSSAGGSEDGSNTTGAAVTSSSSSGLRFTVPDFVQNVFSGAGAKRGGSGSDGELQALRDEVAYHRGMEAVKVGQTMLALAAAARDATRCEAAERRAEAAECRAEAAERRAEAAVRKAAEAAEEVEILKLLLEEMQGAASSSQQWREETEQPPGPSD